MSLLPLWLLFLLFFYVPCFVDYWYFILFQRFYSYLDLKAKQPDANVPPLETCLMRITEPDRDDIDERTLVSIENLDKAFELKENPKVRCKHLSYLFWSNMADG